ncbi:energy transducer TonB [Flavobacterium sp. HXWNR69]|uniref:Energy transducer TonB n=1 Tax=Flavobacterium fragile TaxID=2949085 RepID=A0ABT0TE43_9FLAO|nr:energy transducer TonB [Flavobacterium sp. HXWNR69]MCL9768886.1 energy transducer TonB [Flavobacterium sp. HXWNR69]
MKKIIFTLVFLICGMTNCNSQINNLKDLLEISELNVEEMVSELQGIWKLNNPEQDTSEKGFITERYIFSYNRDNKKQVLKKCGRMDLLSSQTMWLTNFISNDKELLNRITKNLVYQGFELKGRLKSNSMYEDGNRIVTIQTESDDDYKLPKDCYSIIVIVDKRINGGYIKSNKENQNIKNKTSNNALNNISNSSNSVKEKINLVKNLSELILISKTSSSEIYSKLNSNWKNIDYPKNEEPLNEWYSFVNEKQYLESYVGWDNGTRKDVRITTFEFSDKNLLDNIIIDLSKTDFKLEETTKEYSTYVNNDDIITIFFDNKTSKKGNYKVELSITPLKATINSKSNYENYNDNGTGLNGRKIIKKPSPEYNCNEQGKVVVEITVDKNGNVINAIAGVNGTTNKSACLLNASKIAALGTKWQPDNNAPDEQIGKIEYNFRLN